MNKEFKEQEQQAEFTEQAQQEPIASEEGTTEATDNTAEESATEPSLEDELARLKDTHLRLVAEYDNYRKRTLKEKSELIRSAGEKVLREILPVVDDLDIAMANIESSEDVEGVREGIRLIYGKLGEFLARQGVKPIEAKDAPFDEELHEAIATFPAPSEELKGKVVDCVKRGYTLGDKVLRHASVVVGQ